GATGISQWSPLASMYTDMRHLRFADGPDEVHHMVVGRAELQKYDLWYCNPVGLAACEFDG
ncbi:MAG: hypothetical protein VXX02_07820, partial [Pseudomonadota bacterium]|nr:hypothetical protein [Pseudomonadota bacterium]